MGDSRERPAILNTFKNITMFRKQKSFKSNLSVNKSYLGESIEAKIRRIVNNKEPISDGAPLIYTERKDGVQPQYDIRTDRFELAVDAMDKVTKTHLAQREQRIGEKTFDTMTESEQKAFNEKFPNNKHNIKKPDSNKDNIGGAEPTQTTDNK